MTKNVEVAVRDIRSMLHEIESCRYKVACDGHIGKDDKLLLFRRFKVCTDILSALLQPRLL